MTATLIAVSALAFGALMVLTRYDVMLVDDLGHPMDRPDGWYEQTIPAATPAEDPSRV